MASSGGLRFLAANGSASAHDAVDGLHDGLHDDLQYDAHGHGGHEHAHPHYELALFAPIGMLALGALFRQMSSRLPVPYTVILLLVGIAIGLSIDALPGDDFVRSSEILGNLDPHLLLHIFLPPLIFESAFSIEWHVFNKSKFSTLFLAGPGLLISTFICGGVVNALYAGGGATPCTSMQECAEVGDACGTDSWSSMAGYLMGVVLSATDPVAVVALLRELGVKAELSTAIEGESLFNDGTALVVFQVLLKNVSGQGDLDAEDIIKTFVYMSGGGLLFGAVVGFVAVSWIGVVFNDAIIEITITVTSAYLCFFVAEYHLKISGVLAVVALGLYCGRYGRMRISPEVQHFLSEFWEMLAYFGNTLIFTIAGIVIASGINFGARTAFDWAMLFVIYLTLLAGRVVVFSTLYGLKAAFSAAPLWKDYAVSVWGGLRGAVGLALALFVVGDRNVCPAIADKVLFFCAGIVVLTVVFNGVSMRNVLDVLEMNVISNQRRMVIAEASKLVKLSGMKTEGLLRADSLFDSAVWSEVRKYHVHFRDGAATPARATGAKIVDVRDDEADMEEARRRVLMVCKQSYWNQFQEGLLGQEAVRFLSFVNNQAIDDHCRLAEWEKCRALLHFTSVADGMREAEEAVQKEVTSAQKQKREILSILDSIPCISAILAVVIASIAVSFSIEGDTTAERPEWIAPFEYTLAATFLVELALRTHCLGNLSSFMADPFAVTDALVVFLDITLLVLGDVLGEFGGYTKSLRFVRLLRLVRLLRAGRLVKKFQDLTDTYKAEEETLFDSAKGITRRIRRHLMYHHLQFGYDVASGFMVAREEAIHVLHDFLAKPSVRDGQEVPNKFASIARRLEDDVAAVRHNIFDMQRLYSEISSSITTAVAARTVLNAQRVAIQTLHHEGMLDNIEHSRMKRAVEAQMKRLQFQPPVIELPSKQTLLRQVKWLEKVEGGAWDEIERAFEQRMMGRGDVIVKEGDSDTSVFVIARGTVAVERAAAPAIELGIGCVFGEISWALGTKRTATIRATSPGFLFCISGEDLSKVAEKDATLMESIWASAGGRMAENMMRSMPEYTNLTSRELSQAVVKRKMECFLARGPGSSAGDREYPFHREGNVFLIKGRAKLKLSAARSSVLSKREGAGAPRQPRSFSTAGLQSAGGGDRDESAAWHFRAPCRVAPEDVEIPAEMTAGFGEIFCVVFSPGARFVAEHNATHGPSALRSNLGGAASEVTHSLLRAEAREEAREAPPKKAQPKILRVTPKPRRTASPPATLSVGAATMERGLADDAAAAEEGPSGPSGPSLHGADLRDC